MPALKNVVVLGGSGNIGGPLLRYLLDDGSFEVTVLARGSSKAIFPSQAKVVRTDFSETSLAEEFKGKDAVISVVGATALGDQKVYIDAAIKAGVKRFIPSEFGIDTLSKVARELVPIMDVKLDVLAYLREKESTGLTWTALFPGLLFDWGLHAGFLGFDISQKRATIWDEGATRFSITNEVDLGKAVASILKQPAETANKNLYIQSVCTTQKEILDAFEAQKRTAWSEEAVKTNEMVALGRQKLAEGDFAASLSLVQAAGYGDVSGSGADFEKRGILANELLGIEKGSVDSTVKTVLQS